MTFQRYGRRLIVVQVESLEEVSDSTGYDQLLVILPNETRFYGENEVCNALIRRFGGSSQSGGWGKGTWYGPAPQEEVIKFLRARFESS